jgi:hypothetical protein
MQLVAGLDERAQDDLSGVCVVHEVGTELFAHGPARLQRNSPGAVLVEHRQLAAELARR